MGLDKGVIQMKKLDHLCWLIILWAVIYVCLVMIPACVDSISGHEANRPQGYVQEMPSVKPSLGE